MRDDYHAFALLRFRHGAATMYEIPTDVVEAELPAALKLVALIRADVIEQCVRDIIEFMSDRSARAQSSKRED